MFTTLSLAFAAVAAVAAIVSACVSLWTLRTLRKAWGRLNELDRELANFMNWSRLREREFGEQLRILADDSRQTLDAVEPRSASPIEPRYAPSAPFRAPAVASAPAEYGPVAELGPRLRAPEPEDAAPFSEALVREWYGRWCRDGIRPQSTPTVEVVALRLARTEPLGDFGQVRFVLEDAPQVAEFVRFSPRGHGTGLALPNPAGTFAEAAAELFSGLTPSAYKTPSMLLSLRPLSIRRRTEGGWEVA